MTTTPKKKRPAPPHAWKKGQSGNPGGKPARPAWWGGHGEDALRMIVATATGIVIPGGTTEHQAAVVCQAKGAPAKLRFEAASMMHDSIYGKPVQSVEVAAPEESPLLRALVALAHPKG